MSRPLPQKAETMLRRRMRGCRFFADLDERELLELETTCSLSTLRRGEFLWRHGADSHSFHYIVSGLVEIRRPTPSAEVTLMAFFGPTECPGVPVVLERRRYGADAVVASAQAVILSINAVTLIERMQRDSRVANAMNRTLLAQLRLLHGKIDVMAAGTVARRLALFLLNLADRFGDELEGGETVIPFGLSRQQIATYIDARVETVIRTLSVWKKSRVVLIHRDSIVLPSIDVLRQSVAG
ncbi:MAG: Crp/Fnr family transcriptional regulator [Polyangiales bacterium]